MAGAAGLFGVEEVDTAGIATPLALGEAVAEFDISGGIFSFGIYLILSSKQGN